MKDTENKIKEFVKRVEDRTNDALEDSLMDEDAKTENFDVNYTDIVHNSAKAKMSKLPWLISIFLILVIAIMFCLTFFSSNPKTLFTQTVDGLFDYLEENINDNVYDIMDGNINLDYTIKASGENSDIFNELSKVDFDADYIKDNAGGQSYIDLNTTYDGEEFVKATIYGDGDSTYVYSPSVSDKYIKLDGNRLSYLMNGSDIKVISNGLNQAIDKVIAGEKIYGSKENLDIDGEVIKSYKVKLVIDNKNRNRVAETFINTLKSNEELVSILAKMKGVDNSDIRKSLDNYLSKIKKDLKECEKLEIVFYVDNRTKDFIKAEALSKIGNVSVTKKDDNKFTYIISVTGEGTLTMGEFAFTVNDNKTKYTYNLYYKKTKDDKVLTESNFDLKYTSKQADSFEKVDVSDNISWSSVNDLERLEIYTKIMADTRLSKFLPIIQKVV